MMTLRERFSKINLKEGSGSVILGVAIMFLAFLAVAVTMDSFNLYYVQSRNQIIADTIGDGAAVAGNTPNGFNERYMSSTANTLFMLNNTGPLIHDGFVISTSEKDELGNETGNILVTANVETENEFFIPIYRSHEERFRISSTSIVRVEPITDSDGWIDSSFITAPGNIPPFITTEKGHRNAAFVTWLINNYLSPEYNLLYDYEAGGSTKGNMFVYDYLKCMGFEEYELPSDTTDVGIANYLLNDIHFGWNRIYDIAEVKESANDGKPVIMISIDKTSNYIRFAVVVPQQGQLSENEIAIARTGPSASNYLRVSFDELFENDKVYFFINK